MENSLLPGCEHLHLGSKEPRFLGCVLKYVQEYLTMESQTRYWYFGTNITQVANGCNITRYLTDTIDLSIFRTLYIPGLTLDLAKALIKKHVKITPLPPNPSGDCFVLLSPEGLYFDGRGWTEKWQQAQQYAMPVDPSERCEVAARLLHGFGLPCEVAYIPRSKITVP